jgi:hypothetical protein
MAGSRGSEIRNLSFDHQIAELDFEEVLDSRRDLRN